VRRLPDPFFLVLVAFTPILGAQSTNASLTGRITDPSKALIVDAKVAASSAGTNIRYETRTYGSGDDLANLSPSPYRMEIEKPGFKKLVKSDVILHVQDALEIDFEMTLGDASETITVEAGAPLMNTESGTVSTVIDRAFVENLPNGKPIVVGATFDPIQVTPVQLISGSRSIQGWSTGTPVDSEDTLHFSELTGVRPMIETYPLEEAAEAYARMMSGDAKFRVVLTM
jgi:hypothetical protein